MQKEILPQVEVNRFYKIVFGLALFTVFYNIAEGVVSIYLGIEDESLLTSTLGHPKVSGNILMSYFFSDG